MSEGELYRKIQEEKEKWNGLGESELAVNEALNRYKAEVLDEARKDFGLDRLIWGKEDMEKRLKTDGTLTQIEKSFLEICIKLVEWFGSGK